MIRKLFIIAVIGTMVLVAGCGKIVPTAPEIDARSTSQSRPELNNTMKKAKEVTVMTRNLYVGTDVDMVIGAQNPNEIPILAAQAFAMLQSTNYAERVEAFVKEIEENQPHLIGLQEVSLIRLQSPGDAIVGGTDPAELVYLSFLKVLLEALIDKGLNYSIAGMVQNADVEIPMIVNPDPTNPAFDDVRLTDFDVVLARHDVAVSNVDEGNFQVTLEVPITDPETGDVIWVITIPRGYVAVDATVGDKTYRFVNTHLEPAVLPIREAQAYELTSILTGETNPVILVGDFNSEAPYGSTYNQFVNSGYIDAWTKRLPRSSNDPGYTFGNDLDLRNTSVQYDKRYDIIFVRNDVLFPVNQVIGPVYADLVGEELSDRTPSGLWPSDHAGVVATLRIPVHGKYVME